MSALFSHMSVQLGKITRKHQCSMQLNYDNFGIIYVSSFRFLQGSILGPSVFLLHSHDLLDDFIFNIVFYDNLIT